MSFREHTINRLMTKGFSRDGVNALVSGQQPAMGNDALRQRHLQSAAPQIGPGGVMMDEEEEEVMANFAVTASSDLPIGPGPRMSSLGGRGPGSQMHMPNIGPGPQIRR